MKIISPVRIRHCFLRRGNYFYTNFSDFYTKSNERINILHIFATDLYTYTS